MGAKDSRKVEIPSCADQVRNDNAAAERWATKVGALTVLCSAAFAAGQDALKAAAAECDSAELVVSAHDVRTLMNDCVAVVKAFGDFRSSRRTASAADLDVDPGTHPGFIPDSKTIIASLPEWARGADARIGPATSSIEEIMRFTVRYQPPESGVSMRRITIRGVVDSMWNTAAGNGRSALSVVWKTTPQDVEPFRPVKRASLPRLHRSKQREVVTLPGFALGTPTPVSSTQSADPWLPEFAPAVTGCPSWLVELFDRAGGTVTTPGHGAPWDMRLWIAALCSVPVDARTGAADLMPFRVQDVIDWLHPDGWANRRRDWHRLPEALERLGSLRVTLYGRLVALVHALAIPKRWDSNAQVILQVRVPRSAAAGVRLDWDRLRRYGARSASLYRAYLAVSAALDGSAHNGLPITRQIAAPVLRDDGEPKRRKDGSIVRAAGELVPNPAARFAPVWTDADAARFLGYDPRDKRRRYDARKALQELHKDGVIDLHRGRGGTFRLFGPM